MTIDHVSSNYVNLTDTHFTALKRVSVKLRLKCLKPVSVPYRYPLGFSRKKLKIKDANKLLTNCKQFKVVCQNPL